MVSEASEFRLAGLFYILSFEKTRPSSSCCLQAAFVDHRKNKKQTKTSHLLGWCLLSDGAEASLLVPLCTCSLQGFQPLAPSHPIALGAVEAISYASSLRASLVLLEAIAPQINEVRSVLALPQGQSDKVGEEYQNGRMGGKNITESLWNAFCLCFLS